MRRILTGPLSAILRVGLLALFFSIFVVDWLHECIVGKKDE